jgi:hypothetical protein
MAWARSHLDIRSNGQLLRHQARRMALRLPHPHQHSRTLVRRLHDSFVNPPLRCTISSLTIHSIAIPWVCLREVPVEVEVVRPPFQMSFGTHEAYNYAQPSPKVAILRFSRGMQQGLLGRISRTSIMEYHAFGIISEGRKSPHHYMICGVQGDFTKDLVANPPKTVWTRELKFGMSQHHTPFFFDRPQYCRNVTFANVSHSSRRRPRLRHVPPRHPHLHGHRHRRRPLHLHPKSQLVPLPPIPLHLSQLIPPPQVPDLDRLRPRAHFRSNHLESHPQQHRARAHDLVGLEEAWGAAEYHGVAAGYVDAVWRGGHLYHE